MISERLVSNQNKTATNQSSDTHGLAVVRVTVIREGQDYLVDVKPLKCPPLGQQPPRTQGSIDSGLCDQLDNTFPTKSPSVINQPEEVSRQKVESKIQSHRQELEKVLWGAKVWGEDCKDWHNWWRKLTTHQNIDFLIIELVLCIEMRKYIWESLLTGSELQAAKTAIVRIRLEDIEHLESLQSLRETIDPVWLAILADPSGDLANICSWAEKKLQELRAKVGKEIEQLSPTYNTGHLGKLDEQLEELDSRQVGLFLYVGHAETKKGEVQFIMTSKQHQSDPVSVDRLQTAFGQPGPAILLLIACGEGESGGRQSIDKLLHTSKVIVAMQLPLSPSAAQRFLERFLEKLDRPSDLYSVVGIARMVSHARHKMLMGSRSHIEAATPVIYSRVPTEVQEPRSNCLSGLSTTILLNVVMMLCVLLTLPGEARSMSIPTSTPTPVATAATTPTPKLTYKPFVIIDGQPNEVTPFGPIELEAEAGTSIRIEIHLKDVAGERVSSSLGKYHWQFKPPDPESAKLVTGDRNFALQYTVPTGRNGQLITIEVEAAGQRHTILVQITIH